MRDNAVHYALISKWKNLGFLLVSTDMFAMEICLSQTSPNDDAYSVSRVRILVAGKCKISTATLTPYTHLIINETSLVVTSV